MWASMLRRWGDARPLYGMWDYVVSKEPSMKKCSAGHSSDNSQPEGTVPVLVCKECGFILYGKSVPKNEIDIEIVQN
jgi:hypothetical protein